MSASEPWRRSSTSGAVAGAGTPAQTSGRHAGPGHSPDLGSLRPDEQTHRGLRRRRVVLPVGHRTPRAPHPGPRAGRRGPGSACCRPRAATPTGWSPASTRRSRSIAASRATCPSSAPTRRGSRTHLLGQDVIYVGGGSSANLIAIWAVHGLVPILRAAWERGVVLSGVSAGAICWFESGLTNSLGPGFSPVAGPRSAVRRLLPARRQRSGADGGPAGPDRRRAHARHPRRRRRRGGAPRGGCRPAADRRGRGPRRPAGARRAAPDHVLTPLPA